MTLTKLVDFFAHSFVKTMEGVYSIRTGLAVVALLALGVAAAARNLAENVLPSLVMRWLHIAEMGELPPFVQWLSATRG